MYPQLARYCAAMLTARGQLRRATRQARRRRTGCPSGASGARRGGGLAGGGDRDVDGLVDGGDKHRGVDGLAVDRLDIGDFPRAMLAIDPDVEAYGAVAQHL